MLSNMVEIHFQYVISEMFINISKPLLEIHVEFSTVP